MVAAATITKLASELNSFLKLSEKKLQTPAVQTAEAKFLLNIATNLKGKTPAQMAAILTGLNSSQQSELKAIMTNLGISLSAGVESGITKGRPKSKASMEAFCLDVIKAADSCFKTGSPSKVFVTIGSNLVAGLVNGIQSKQSTATGSMTNLSNAMLATLRASLPQFHSLGAQMSAAVAAGAASRAALPRTTTVATTAAAVATPAAAIGQFSPTYHVTVQAAATPAATAKAVTTAIAQQNAAFIAWMKAGSSW